MCGSKMRIRRPFRSSAARRPGSRVSVGRHRRGRRRCARRRGPASMRGQLGVGPARRGPSTAGQRHAHEHALEHRLPPGGVVEVRRRTGRARRRPAGCRWCAARRAARARRRPRAVGITAAGGSARSTAAPLGGVAVPVERRRPRSARPRPAAARRAAAPRAASSAVQPGASAVAAAAAPAGRPAGTRRGDAPRPRGRPAAVSSVRRARRVLARTRVAPPSVDVRRASVASSRRARRKPQDSARRRAGAACECRGSSTATRPR